MEQHVSIKAEECAVYLASPVDYDDLVVIVDHSSGMQLTLVCEASTDHRYAVEIPGRIRGQSSWIMPLAELRGLLDRAELLLRNSLPGQTGR